MTEGPTLDEEQMALCAIRYCIGRSSYIVSDGVKWARRYGTSSPWVRRIVIRDIEECVDRIEQSAGWQCLGDPHDEAQWRAVLSELKAMEKADACAVQQSSV